jgi:hypothetical protein
VKNRRSKDKLSTNEDPSSQVIGLAPKSDANPPGIPPHYVYSPRFLVYLSPEELELWEAESAKSQIEKERDSDKDSHGLNSVYERGTAEGLDRPSVFPKPLGGKRKRSAEERDLFSDLSDEGDAPQEAIDES